LNNSEKEVMTDDSIKLKNLEPDPEESRQEFIQPPVKAGEGCSMLYA